MKILITGSSGFVGQNLVNDFIHKYSIYTESFRYNKSQKIEFNQDVIIHLSGKAHDLNGTSDLSEYFDANFKLTKQLYDAFINCETSQTFIFISSVKAVSDSHEGALTENSIPNPKTDYGKSKLAAENYILGKKLPKNKRYFILRPCMIHGPKNKGNLNLLYLQIKKKPLWPLGSYENKKSFLSINNFIFVIDQIINDPEIKSGIYNIADDDPISTNKLVSLIFESLSLNPTILNIPKPIIKVLATFGDYTKSTINSDRLKKLTEDYEVCNKKIIRAIKKKLPTNTKDGLLKTFKSFNNKF